ncbi:MAG: DUF3861 family protein [Muribaculaceae bacterium]|jgi:hypothetical protein|nr:DUF3861 family protein [Muribaculaceae bacterium]
MDCKCNKEKRSYHFNVTEVVDGKIQEVMNFNFGGHHDLGAMVAKTAAKGDISEKHAKELVLGIRLLHHALKKCAGANEIFSDFYPVFEEFKKTVKEHYNG